MYGFINKINDIVFSFLRFKKLLYNPQYHHLFRKPIYFAGFNVTV